MAIRNIIQKAEQEFPPALKQELDPIAIAELALLSGNINTIDSNLAITGSTLNTKIDNLSGYSDNTFYTKNNPSGFITNQNVVFTTGTQTISGDKTFQAESYIFSGADVTITGFSTFAIDIANTTTNGIVKNFGSASGMQVMTTGEYDLITPVSGVVYILT